MLEGLHDFDSIAVEMVGYVGRVLSAAQNPGPYTLGPYIIQSILLLIAPALFAAR